jgi:hypothetical protein
MKYFTQTGWLRPRYRKRLEAIGWHVPGIPLYGACRELFTKLSPSDVRVIHFQDIGLADVGNPEGFVILIEVGYDSAHSVWDMGRKRAEKLGSMLRCLHFEADFDSSLKILAFESPILKKTNPR